MQKRTFGAGVVVGVIAACSGAGVETVGDAMVEAGEMLEDAGEMLSDAGHDLRDASMGMLAEAGVDAGEVLSDAGEIIRDAGHVVSDAGRDMNPDADAEAQEPVGDGLPRAHWILRDKSGSAVEAEVYPSWQSEDHTKFSSGQPPCVGIGYLGARAIGLSYALAHGRLDSCDSWPPVSSWRESPWSYFTDNRCEGQAYSTSSGVPTQKVGSSYYYVDGPPTITTSTPTYIWSAGACTAGGSQQKLWAYKLVPEDIVNLLPNAPYTLELVY